MTIALGNLKLKIIRNSPETSCKSDPLSLKMTEQVNDCKSGQLLSKVR